MRRDLTTRSIILEMRDILQQDERIDMFVIARKHITPRRMLYRARIVLESYSNRARIAIVIGPLHAHRAVMPVTNKKLNTVGSADGMRSPQNLAC